ncbi:MAG TPA: hypothetical protein VGM44_11205 [Polyangiaceae bacterium]|jgi:hypothetical protein
MTKHIAFIAAATLAFASACSGGDGSSSSTKTRDLELVVQCSGTYSCIFTALEQTDPAEAIISDNELGFSNNVCTSELFNLYPNGNVVFNATLEQPPGTWTGNRNEFSACFSDSKLGCVECSLTSAASAPGAQAHCVGQSESCSATSGCHQIGCHIEVSAVSSVYDTCEGAATPCSDIGNAGSCIGQLGCTWH